MYTILFVSVLPSCQFQYVQGSYLTTSNALWCYFNVCAVDDSLLQMQLVFYVVWKLINISNLQCRTQSSWIFPANKNVKLQWHWSICNISWNQWNTSCIVFLHPTEDASKINKYINVCLWTHLTIWTPSPDNS